jgi:hypothetical protein
MQSDCVYELVRVRVCECVCERVKERPFIHDLCQVINLWIVSYDHSQVYREAYDVEYNKSKKKKDDWNEWMDGRYVWNMPKACVCMSVSVGTYNIIM